ncbi:sodium:solute symporter family protein [Halomonas dongshanensis]|uniref:Sodium:solute symporter family protein n=1 Tax=Halomonas dongshanensis TaxID=2890835 RepID=A0ABT2E898_9GAMM|nr:sodium:solute symporter family protein [Halomonas dongshanensis]MCS2607798.1 sodium:solute symporter family protein [Halomonas dongshanensis]
MEPAYSVLLITAIYMLVLALISFAVRKHSRNAKNFTTGGAHFPAVLIGLLMMSEFIGTTASVGTAQAAYTHGISAAWNLAALGIGFVIFSLLLARKYKELGENTISGALAKAYGEPVRLATSVIMICALMIVAVSVYASGGAILSGLMGIDRTYAIIVTGVVAVMYVSIGGMRSVIYTNTIHAIVMYAGIILAVGFALSNVGGIGSLTQTLPAEMFEPGNVGWSQIFAWLVAGIGATFATQYIVQAITTVSDGRKAQTASFFCALMLIPYALFAALVGMCAAVMFPGIEPLQAFPSVLSHMNTLAAGIVVAGIAGALFGTIAALTMGCATLALKDFYQRFFNPGKDDRKDLIFVKLATIFAGLVPISLAIFASGVLEVTFLAKALRTALAVLVLMMFYAPHFGSQRGAFLSIIASLVVTVSWFLMGNPYGIDNAYVALVTPLIIMTASHILRGAPDRLLQQGS